MPSKSYFTVDGELIGERVTGGARTDYLTDALGSVTATVDQSGAVTAAYRAKPYGDRLSKTGSGTDPAFQWLGAWGYRLAGLKGAEQYVRARHYGSGTGRWTTVDPLWPREGAYGYVRGRPTKMVDPSGRQVGRNARATGFLPGLMDPPLRPLEWPPPAVPESVGDWLLIVPSELVLLAGELLTVTVSDVIPYLLDVNVGMDLVPHARELLRYYLNIYKPSRTFHLTEADMISLIGVNTDWCKNLYEVLRYAESRCRRENFHSAQAGDAQAKPEVGDWYYALDLYETWAKASVSVRADRITVAYTYSIHDNYDWDPNNSSRLPHHKFMYALAQRGLASVFEIRGELRRSYSWKRGHVEEALRRASANHRCP